MEPEGDKHNQTDLGDMGEPKRQAVGICEEGEVKTHQIGVYRPSEKSGENEGHIESIAVLFC